jgi:PAS domain S-box-containing protein
VRLWNCNRRAFIRLALLPSLLFVVANDAIGERPPIRTYTTADGLAYNRIVRIVRDSHGLLWFCTADGLSRFDGARFTNYNVEDGLPSSSINDLLETSGGVYWVATNGGGLARLNSAEGTRQVPETRSHVRFTIYPVGNHAVSNRINVLFEDSGGALWAATDGGLYRMDETKGEREFTAVDLHIPSRPDLSVQVWAIVEYGDGSLWIATKFGLVRRLPDGQMIHYQIQPNPTGDVVWSLIKDNDGNLWLSHQSGVIVFKPQPGRQSQTGDEFLPLPADARRYTMKSGTRNVQVRLLLQSSTGRIWGSDTSPGISWFDGKTFQPYPIGQLVDQAISIGEDRDGNLWLGTYGNGAIRIALQGFTTYDTKDSLGSVIGSVFESHTGDLYVSSAKWLISRFDGNKFVSVKINLPRSVTEETDWRASANVIQDRGGDWWVGTRLGLYRFGKVSRFEKLGTARPKAVYTRQDGMADDDVTRLFEDSQGDIWIAGFGVGREVVTRWERSTGTFHRYSEADGLRPFTVPGAICEDTARNLWIAFPGGGLARYRDGRFTLLTESDGVSARSIRDLYLDQAGRLWFSQGQVGSLYRTDDTEATLPTLTAYTKDDGLSTHRLSCITGDSAGRIYVGNSRGIDRLDPRTRQIRHYTAADGFGTGELIAAFRDRLGNLWFGTTAGLLRLTPRPEQDAKPPDILINQLHIAGNAYHVSELGEREISGLEMEPNQNQIQIDFFALSFGAGEALRFQYKLEGAYSDWSAPTDLRTINYANLAPGLYRFLVRAINSNGATSESPAIVTFRILPPIWKRWWFLMLIAMMAAAVSLALARSRITRLKAEGESDKRFRTLAETASDAIITIDEKSHIVLANQAAGRIFGYAIEEMVGNDLTMLMPEYLRHLHRHGFARYKDTGKRHISWQAIELPGLHKSGAEIPLEIAFGEFR